jgi:WD40 repeat protein
MDGSRFPYMFARTITLICLLITLSSCTILGGASRQATPTPLPTSSISGLQVVSPQACLVAQQGMIRVENPQGDLISWSPTGNTVAYVASTQGSSWNVGELNILTAPKFDNPERLGTQVAGELAWSPNATTIAYLALRRSDTLYTIGLAYPDRRPSKDLFPGEAARTDDFSSQKAVIEWIDDGRLKVDTSCGLDCMQEVDFGVITGLSTLRGDPIQKDWKLWSVHTNQPITIPPDYADLPGQLNWSPDESQIAYIDEDGLVWIIDVSSGELYPLDIGAYGTATETDWSYDNQYLAVHVDQNLEIFSFKCP